MFLMWFFHVLAHLCSFFYTLVYQLMKLLLEYGEVQLALVQAILRGLRPPENLDVAKALAPEVKGMKCFESLIVCIFRYVT